MGVPENEKAPAYEHIIGKYPFHWKSFAIYHTCMEVFRRSGDDIYHAFIAEYQATQLTRGELTPEERIHFAAYRSCQAAKLCKDEKKKKRERDGLDNFFK